MSFKLKQIIIEFLEVFTAAGKAMIGGSAKKSDHLFLFSLSEFINEVLHQTVTVDNNFVELKPGARE